jgi:hypothetical protein
MKFPHEEVAAMEFIKAHRCKRGSERNKLTLRLTWDNGIGVHYEAVCPVCGRTKDVTNYECW